MRLNNKEIFIAAALITRQDGKVLLVRKRGSVAFIQPGGKLQPDEAPIVALCRELQEELGLILQHNRFIYIGRYSALAVNEAEHTVIAEVFKVQISQNVTPQAEIEEVIWIDPTNYAADLILAPLTEYQLLPLCKS